MSNTWYCNGLCVIFTCRLRVAIEREMFPDNGPIPIYLFVTEHDTIKYLQEMVKELIFLYYNCEAKCCAIVIFGILCVCNFYTGQ